MAKPKSWTAGELEAIFGRNAAALQAVAATPDCQGVMFDIDKKTNQPCARVVMKKGSKFAGQIPANAGEIPLKVESSR